MRHQIKTFAIPDIFGFGILIPDSDRQLLIRGFLHVVMGERNRDILIAGHLSGFLVRVRKTRF